MTERNVKSEFEELKNAIYSLSTYCGQGYNKSSGSVVLHENNSFFYKIMIESPETQLRKLYYNDDSVSVALNSNVQEDELLNFIIIYDRFSAFNDNHICNTKLQMHIPLFHEDEPEYILMSNTAQYPSTDVSAYTEEELFQFSLLHNISTDYNSLKKNLELFKMIRNEFKDDKIIRSVYDVISISFTDDLPLNTKFRMWK